jgi:hypothetical protein
MILTAEARRARRKMSLGKKAARSVLLSFGFIDFLPASTLSVPVSQPSDYDRSRTMPATSNQEVMSSTNSKQ